MQKTRKQDLVIGIIAIIIGVAAFIEAQKFPSDTQSYTFFATIVFTLLGIILTVSSIVNAKKPSPGTEEVSLKSFTNPLLMFLIVLVYTILIGLLGFFTSSIIFMLGTMYFMGYRRPLPMILTTIGLLGFVYFLFVIQLKVCLPTGILF